MVICPHGRIAETCHSCYPGLLVPEQILPPPPPPGQAVRTEVCVHGNPSSGCVQCSPLVQVQGI